MNIAISLPIVLISFLILGFDTWAFPLISPDEPRYAETAREMMEIGNYIVPICDYLPRFDKPILFYWFEILSFKVFGINEFAARLPSVFAGTGLVYLGYILGSLHGIGILTAVILLSSFMITILSKIAITDMSLCFFISASLVFFYLAYYEINNQKKKFAFKDRVSSKYIIVSALTMAMGMLCKGPVAVVLPSLIIISFLVYKRSFRDFILDSWLELLIGLIVFVLVSMPWYIGVDLATQGAFTEDFFIGHNLNRFTNVHTNHSAPIWFYIPVIFLGFFPWSFFLVQSLIKTNFGKRFSLNSEDYKVRDTMIFALIWTIVIFVFFTLSKTKLLTYTLPLFLPLALINALWWNEKFKISAVSKFKNLDALIGFVALFASLVTGLMLSSTAFKKHLLELSNTGFFVQIALISFILLSCIFISMTAIFDKPKLSFILLAASSIIAYSLVTNFFLKSYAEYRDDGSKAFAQKLKSKDKVITFEVHPTRFNFYSDRSKVVKAKSFRDLRTKIQSSESPVILITKARNKNKILEQITECKEYKPAHLKQTIHKTFKCQ